MASPTQNDVPERTEWLCTQTKGGCIQYKWIITNFNRILKKNGSILFTPAFPTNKDNEQWKLEVNLEDPNNHDSEWISLCLHLVRPKMADIRVEYEFVLFRSKQFLRSTSSTHAYKESGGYGYLQFIERAKLFSPDNPDDTITIRCNIKIMGTYITSSLNSTSANKNMTFESKVYDMDVGFRTFYNNSQFSDFNIISGDKTFPTHKVVLASRSTVFAAMLRSEEMDESVKNEVKIRNIEPTVVEAMLEFIYTGGVAKIEKLAHGLLAAAEQYALEGLKSLCQETLYRALNKNNAVEILVLADFYRADQLKKNVMQYILDHRLDVVQSENYKTTTLPGPLAKELITALILPGIDETESET